jgi:sec-independent protein translocase protein TatB
MFDLSFGEILLLAVVALVFIGPKELPAVARACAKVMAYLKALAREFRAAFDDLARESGIKEAQKEAEREIRLITGDDGKTYESYDISDFLPKK